MSEDKKSLINLVPDSVDNAVKNITDKPTQNAGTTLADIWYLVFGGISHAAEKRKLKYSYALQEFEKELKEKISKIPEDKLIEPDIQIIAPALEASKYCIENTELRKMFSSYISSSMDIDLSDYTHPIFIDILKNLKPFECKILYSIYTNSDVTINTKNHEKILINFLLQLTITINKLNTYGLIKFETAKDKLSIDEQSKLLEYIQKNKIDEVNDFFNCADIISLNFKSNKKGKCKITFKLNAIPITPLGIAFKLTCFE